MAERRCFTQKIINSDAFLDMPLSTQALYFHLSMGADDDGFVNNPRRIQRLVGASEDDLKLLIAKRFALAYEDGVIVIKHWRMHNTLKKDRLKKPHYPEIAARIYIKENGSYTENPAEGTISLLEHKTAALEEKKIEHLPSAKEKLEHLPNVDEEDEPSSDENTEEKTLEFLGGTLGKGVVMISAQQMDALLDKMSLDEFNHYVEKLANYILRNPQARIHSHYKTIIKWWGEDRAV